MKPLILEAVPLVDYREIFNEILDHAEKYYKQREESLPYDFARKDIMPELLTKGTFGTTIVDFCNYVAEQSDILQVVSQYTILKRDGRFYCGRCPICGSSADDPLVVFPDGGSFYCSDCLASGNAIHFIKYVENIDYIDAAKVLAKRFGISLPEEIVYERPNRGARS